MKIKNRQWVSDTVNQNNATYHILKENAYRFLVPDQIGGRLGDLGYKVENQDEDHDEWTNHSPCHLPENIGLVADHEFNIFVKPAEKQRAECV